MSDEPDILDDLVIVAVVAARRLRKVPIIGVLVGLIAVTADEIRVERDRARRATDGEHP